MKKLFICLILALAIFGCDFGEKRIYLDIMAGDDINKLTSAGPFQRVYVSYSSFRSEWDIDAKIKISGTVVEISVSEPTLKGAFLEIQKNEKRLKEACEEGK